MIRTKTKLPRKLSALLTLAVNDAQAVAKRKGYVFNMGNWHQPYAGGERCSVCMAGAVIANTLGVEMSRHAEPDSFRSKATQDALYAINDLRTGDVNDAAAHLDVEPTFAQQKQMGRAAEIIGRGYVGSYSGRAPWGAYRKAARILKAAGL